MPDSSPVAVHASRWWPGDATNSGISAIITPTGEFLQTIGVDERGSLVATVTPERDAWSLMLAWATGSGRRRWLVPLER